MGVEGSHLSHLRSLLQAQWWEAWGHQTMLYHDWEEPRAEATTKGASHGFVSVASTGSLLHQLGRPSRDYGQEKLPANMSEVSRVYWPILYVTLQRYLTSLVVSSRL